MHATTPLRSLSHQLNPATLLFRAVSRLHMNGVIPYPAHMNGVIPYAARLLARLIYADLQALREKLEHVETRSRVGV